MPATPSAPAAPTAQPAIATATASPPTPVTASPAATATAGPATSTPNRTPSAVARVSATPPPASTGLDLRAITFRDARDGWAGGEGVILATTDGGKTWTRQYDGPETIQQLHFLTDTDGWAVGDRALLRTTDGGATWSPAGEPPQPLHQLAVLSPTLIWGTTAPLGTLLTGDPSRDGLYVSHDGGQTWTRQPTPIPVGSICFVDAQHAWTVNAPGATLPALLATPDGGTTWRRLPLPPVLPPGPAPTPVPPGKPFTTPYPTVPKQTLGCFASGVLWDYLDFGPVGAGGGEAYVLARSADGGRTWTGVVQHQVPWLNRGFAPTTGLSVPGELDVVDSDTVYLPATCFNCGLPAGKSSVGSTTDGGRTWHEADVPGLPASAMALDFITPERGWLVGRPGLGPRATPPQSVILATTDGGRTWTQQYPPAKGTAATLPAGARSAPSAAAPSTFRASGAWFANAATGWVTGQSCQEQPQPAPGASERATPVPPVCAGLIEATTDGGRTWQRQYAGADVLGPIQFVSATTGWAVRWHGPACIASGSPCASVLMGTDDGGRHWADLSTTPLRLVQLAFTGTSQGWLLALRCGDANQVGPCAAHVLVTVDGGRAWRDTALPLRARNVDLSHPTATDGWVAASLGAPGQPALLASHDGGGSWQPLADPGPGFEQRVFFRDAKQGWLLAGGEPGAGAQMKELFETVDGGHTWTKLAWTGGFGEPGSIGTGGLPAGGYVGQVVFPTAQDGWIASPRGALLHSADGGKTWRPAPIDAHFFSAVGFVTVQLGWAVSDEGPAVWLTDDAGRTWRAVALPG